MTSQRNIHNERGSIVISTMVIISIVLVIMSGVVTMKLTELSKQTVKVNEAYRYLNIMEEMGMMVARARQLGRAGGTCPSGTFPHTATVNFCLPSYNASGTMQSACITDTTQKDRSGNDIRYCLMPAASSGITTTQNRNDDRPDVEFNVVQVKVPSMIERAFFAMVSPLQSAHAGCSLNQNWNVPCTPNNDGAGNYNNVTSEPNIVPAGYTTAPTGTGAASSTSYANRNNMESWAPADPSWTTGGTNASNEIYTPSCNVTANPEQYWLGCMSCTDAKVLCIDIRMCPPVYATGTASCANPYRQRIAVYPDEG